jgi:hypothetical protein
MLKTFETPFSPVKFHTNCISSISPDKILKLKHNQRTINYWNGKKQKICSAKPGTDHFCKVWIKLRRSPEKICDGQSGKRQTDDGEAIYISRGYFVACVLFLSADIHVEIKELYLIHSWKKIFIVICVNLHSCLSDHL